MWGFSLNFLMAFLIDLPEYSFFCPMLRKAKAPLNFSSVVLHFREGAALKAFSNSDAMYFALLRLAKLGMLAMLALLGAFRIAGAGTDAGTDVGGAETRLDWVCSITGNVSDTFVADERVDLRLLSKSVADERMDRKLLSQSIPEERMDRKLLSRSVEALNDVILS